jgi:hypothetical protein
LETLLDLLQHMFHQQQTWLLQHRHNPSGFPDTVANFHIQPDTQHLNAVNEYTGPNQLMVGNSQGLHISHTGNGTISTPHTSLSLKNVLCVPEIQKHLLSVQKFTTYNSIFF